MNNKIIETQELLFKEMNRIDATDGLDNEEAQLEFDRASALYTTSTCFIKAINTNINIMNTARREEIKYEDLMKKLGL